jgi:chemotaxis methyl-accepting protein methylase
MNNGINTTEIGRYASEKNFKTLKFNPIIQSLVNPTYSVSSLEYKDGYASIPEDAIPLKPRIESMDGDVLKVLDVGCSNAANIHLLEDFLRKNTNKKIVVKGYDRDKKILKSITDKKTVYSSYKLQSVVRESVDRHFTQIAHVDLPGDNEEYCEYLLKPESAADLAQKVFKGDAIKLPEPKGLADVLICTNVLMHNSPVDQWKILEGLASLAKKGGLIYTSQYFMKRTEHGVESIDVHKEPIVSFSDPKKAVWYGSLPFNFKWEDVYPVAHVSEIAVNITKNQKSNAKKF